MLPFNSNTTQKSLERIYAPNLPAFFQIADIALASHEGREKLLFHLPQYKYRTELYALTSICLLLDVSEDTREGECVLRLRRSREVFGLQPMTHWLLCWGLAFLEIRCMYYVFDLFMASVGSVMPR
ncbi:hypothetical protein TcBrA4_0039350 [Trypanosoma cruzi]|nr:hypothetical protein TcBrA4_0039350 [Trypanosoma cruzi]